MVKIKSETKQTNFGQVTIVRLLEGITMRDFDQEIKKHEGKKAVIIDLTEVKHILNSLLFSFFTFADGRKDVVYVWPNNKHTRRTLELVGVESQGFMKMAESLDGAIAYLENLAQ